MFTSIEAAGIGPVAWKPRAMHVRYHLFETAIGTCGIAWSDAGICRFQLPERDAAATERRMLKWALSAEQASPDAAISPAVEALQRYMAGDHVEMADIAVDISGVPAFQRRIYDALRQVGWGRTVSYGELAERIGSPGGARAVGQAMGSNPVPVIIPCHRVLASKGKIGGFSAYGGAVTKERLLGLEGVSVAGGAPLLALIAKR